MIVAALRNLIGRPLPSVISLLGLVIALTGCLALTSAAQVTEATLTADIRGAWRTPYDLLVRPKGVITDLESGQGLVRTNFVSGLHGGITLAQLARIRNIPGVEVAAPVGVIGFVLWPSRLEVSLPPATASAGLTVYRVRVTASADAGLSRLPVEERYVLASSEGTLHVLGRQERLVLGGRSIPCEYPVTCAAPRVCFDAGCSQSRLGDAEPYILYVLQPIVVAAIDPTAEEQLVDLRRCVRSGRYLSGTDVPVDLRPRVNDDIEQLPALVSERSFIDETLNVEISAASDPAAVLAGMAPTAITSWSPLPGVSRDIDQLYRDFLPDVAAPYGRGYADPYPIWSTGDTTFAVGTADLRAQTLPPAPSILVPKEGLGFGQTPDSTMVPAAARDDWFRTIEPHPDRYPLGPTTPYRQKKWDIVGTYDPACLPNFDPRAGGGGLETYSLPEVRLSDGSVLRPNRNPAGYVSSPPLVLTTFDAAAWLADPRRYEGQSGEAPISTIRIRVAGIDDPSKASQDKLLAVASEIYDATDLQVDVVKGASTKSVAVELPPGRFGRPQLQVAEAWFVKGTVVRFGRVIGTQTVLFIAVILAVAALQIATGATASARRRGRELAVLHALGWTRQRIAALQLLELAALGVIGGAIASVAALLLQSAQSAPTSIANLALIPLGLVLAVVSGSAPLLLPARASTAQALAGQAGHAGGRPPTSAEGVGVRDLLRTRKVELSLAATGIGGASALVGMIVIIARAFEQRLDATVLGAYLRLHAEPLHVVLALAACVIGALAGAQLCSATYIERQTALATLRAVGWPRAWVLRLLAAQALVVALVGSVLGAMLVLVAAAVLRPGVGGTSAGLIAVAMTCALSAVVSACVPLLLAYRARPASLLSEP